MSRRDELAAAYSAAPDREAYLRGHSGLPGPRGNLELIDVASAATDRANLERWAALGPEVAPENTPDVFLACVGTVGLGRIVGTGDHAPLPTLRRLSNDPRWRVREAVAMGSRHGATSTSTRSSTRWSDGPAVRSSRDGR